MPEEARQQLVFAGTYTRGDSVGIYAFRFDPVNGALTFTGDSARTQNPSYLALSSNGAHLYAVGELHGPGPDGGGAVTAWRVDRKTGGLTALNQQASHGNSPCHVVLDRENRLAFVANYSSGSLCVLPIRGDGSLGSATTVVQHEGHGADPGRQEGPHAHSMLVDDAHGLAYAADLGIDRLMVYRIDFSTGKLAPADPPFVPVHPGAGPRHMALSPKGRFLYVIHELDSTVSVFRRDSAARVHTHVQTISALPTEFRGKSFCADIHVHPSGRFVYGSNRGHDSIVAYRVHPETGVLTCIGHTPTRGQTPRGFALDPSGRFLLAANQDSFKIAVFRIDSETGILEFSGQEVPVPFPVCLKFLPAARPRA